MSKTAFFERFNEKTDEFIKDLTTSFPDIEQFRYFKSGFTMLKNFDPKSPQRIFNTYISTSYRDYILNRDESFFLDHDINVNASERKEYWNEFISYIKEIWKGLDESNKDVIWKYFHVLLILNDKCME